MTLAEKIAEALWGTFSDIAIEGDEITDPVMWKYIAAQSVQRVLDAEHPLCDDGKALRILHDKLTECGFVDIQGLPFVEAACLFIGRLARAEAQGEQPSPESDELYKCIREAVEGERPVMRDAEQQPDAGVALIRAERLRQIGQEGWTLQHDYEDHGDEQLLLAATAYCQHLRNGGPMPDVWPWETQWWKPTPNDPIRQLVKAGALLAAEIDRRLAEAQSQEKE